MVITPTGGMRACSMYEETYASQKAILKDWVPMNECGECYVSIRSYLDASFWTLLKDNLSNRVFSHERETKQC